MADTLPRKELQDAVLKLLASGMILHVAHIASKSLTRHTALERAYEALEGCADLLGEVSLGIDGTVILQEYSNLDAIAEINSCIDHLLSLSEKIKDSPLKALVEDQISKLRREVFILQQTTG